MQTWLPKKYWKAALICVASLLILPLLCLILRWPIDVLGMDPDPNRYLAQIESFDQHVSDSESRTYPIVFVGSSSIRNWNVERSFADMYVLNHGFGGSELSDLFYFVERTVLEYHPFAVVVYAGENDLVGRKTAGAVLKDYRNFVTRVQKDYPEVFILYISIKQSPARWNIREKIDDANDKIRAYSGTNPNLFFIDINQSMLNQSGELNSRLFLEDGVHLSDKGYEAWTIEVSRTLESLYQHNF